MRVLLSSTPAHGHLQPMLPLAHALRAAGHEVAVATAPGMGARAAAAGLEVLEAGLDTEEWFGGDRHRLGAPHPRAAE